MIAALLVWWSIAHAQVEAESYEKFLHCWFKLKNEKHSFHVYSNIGGGPSWVAFKQALYSSYRTEISDPKKTRDLPLNWEFRIGALPNGQWQAHVLAKLTENKMVNKKKVLSGSITIIRHDGKAASSELYCR